MDSTAPAAVRTTPRDFFLWLGAIVALYSALTSTLILLFSYLDRVLPDPLDGYVDLLGAGSRAAMATLLIAAPLTVILLRAIRRTLEREPARAELWVRRWAIVATLFIAGAVLAIDLVVVVNGFLGGELTLRFILKALVVLLVAGAVFLHFLADLRGYWLANPRLASLVGAGFIVGAVATVATGFLVIGTPGQLRAARLDQQRVDDLRSLQYQVVDRWQRVGTLPASLSALKDDLSWFELPLDPESGAPYEYRVVGERSFELCAAFSGSSTMSPAYRAPVAGRGLDDSFAHEAGRTCFVRTIDPLLYPPAPAR